MEHAEARAAASALTPAVAAQLLTVCLTEMACQWARVLHDEPGAVLSIPSNYPKAAAASAAMKRAWPLVIEAVEAASPESAVRFIGRDVTPVPPASRAAAAAGSGTGAESGSAGDAHGRVLPLAPRLVMGVAAWALRLAGSSEAEAALCRAAHAGALPWTSAWLCLPLGLRKSAPMCAGALMALRTPAPGAVRRLAAAVALSLGSPLAPLPVRRAVEAAAEAVALAPQWVDAAVSLLERPTPVRGSKRRRRHGPSTPRTDAGTEAEACGAVLVAQLLHRALGKPGGGAAPRRASPARDTLPLAAMALLGGVAGYGHLAGVVSSALPTGAAAALRPAARLVLAGAAAEAAGPPDASIGQRAASRGVAAAAAAPGVASRIGGSPALAWSVRSWEVQAAGVRLPGRGLLPVQAQALLVQAQRSLARWALRRGPLAAAGAESEAGGGDAEAARRRQADVAMHALRTLLNCCGLFSAADAVDTTVALLNSDAGSQSSLEALARHCWGTPEAVVRAALELLTRSAQRVRRLHRTMQPFAACVWVPSERRQPTDAHA